MADNLLEATIDLLWRQWRAIGGGAATNQPVTKQVDPEVLCLVSLALQDQEARLGTVLADWLRVGASLLSVQRAKNLATQFPHGSEHLRSLAQAALREAMDARWSSVLEQRPRFSRSKLGSKQRSGGVALVEPAALVLRFRAGFNVGLKSDLLAFLLGQPLRVSVSVAANALGYGVPAVFRALQDLVKAAFARSADLPAAAEYWVDASMWRDLLGGPDAAPRWGHWREILAYTCAAFDLEHQRAYLKSSEYARATTLRELAEQHEAGLIRSGMVEHVPRSAEFEEWRDFHNSLAHAITAAG